MPSPTSATIMTYFVTRSPLRHSLDVIFSLVSIPVHLFLNPMYITLTQLRTVQFGRVGVMRTGSRRVTWYLHR